MEEKREYKIGIATDDLQKVNLIKSYLEEKKAILPEDLKSFAFGIFYKKNEGEYICSIGSRPLTTWKYFIECEINPTNVYESSLDLYIKIKSILDLDENFSFYGASIPFEELPKKDIILNINRKSPFSGKQSIFVIQDGTIYPISSNIAELFSHEIESGIKTNDLLTLPFKDFTCKVPSGYLSIKGNRIEKTYENIKKVYDMILENFSKEWENTFEENPDLKELFSNLNILPEYEFKSLKEKYGEK